MAKAPDTITLSLAGLADYLEASAASMVEAAARLREGAEVPVTYSTSESLRPSFTPSKVRKRPVTVEAMLFDGDTAHTHAVYQWIEANTQGSFDPLAEEVPASGVSIDPATGFMLIATLEGVMQVKVGDYVIRGVEGEFYPCKPDIFAKTYEKV